jgi:hypothetical protein
MYLIIKLKEKAGKISLRQRCNPYALQGKNHAIQKAERRGDRGYVGHFLVFPLSNVFKDII